MAALGTATEYFTCWALGAHIVAKFDTRPLAALVSLAGGYLTHIHPRFLSVAGFRLEGVALWMVDFCFHHLPLIVLLLYSSGVPWTGYTATAALGLAYLAVFPEIHSRYGLRAGDVMVLIVIIMTLSYSGYTIATARRTSRSRTL